jgi:hypothetical protein
VRACRPRSGLGVAPGVARTMDRQAQRRLKLAGLACVGLGHEGYDNTSGAGAPGTARAVQVVLLIAGEIEVDDAADVVDMDAAGGNIGSHERLCLTADEGPQSPVSLGLRPTAVDGNGVNASPLELSGETIDTVLGAAEHDR